MLFLRYYFLQQIVLAECTAIDAFKHAGPNITFASGSPFENVDLGKLHIMDAFPRKPLWLLIGEAANLICICHLMALFFLYSNKFGKLSTHLLIGNGKIGHVNQANNMYLFPG